MAKNGRGQDLVTANNTKRAVEMRMAGFTYDKIGNALGFSRQRAHQLVTKELANKTAITHETVNDLRALLNKRWDELLVRLWYMAMPQPTRDEPDVIPEPDLAYVDRVMKVLEQITKLNGVDVPSKSDMDFTAVQDGGSRFGMLILRFLPEDQHQIFLEELDKFNQEQAALIGVHTGKSETVINELPVVDEPE